MGEEQILEYELSLSDSYEINEGQGPGQLMPQRAKQLHDTAICIGSWGGEFNDTNVKINMPPENIEEIINIVLYPESSGAPKDYEAQVIWIKDNGYHVVAQSRLWPIASKHKVNTLAQIGKRLLGTLGG